MLTVGIPFIDNEISKLEVLPFLHSIARIENSLPIEFDILTNFDSIIFRKYSSIFGKVKVHQYEGQKFSDNFVNSIFKKKLLQIAKNKNSNLFLVSPKYIPEKDTVSKLKTLNETIVSCGITEAPKYEIKRFRKLLPKNSNILRGYFGFEASWVPFNACYFNKDYIFPELFN
ncbi:hypothetical protein M0R04_15910, partial [Candidatus Dojkabacteria bacterium]|nr:hypothetical protein [Candidatus Dojkabacteria bacterium]